MVKAGQEFGVETWQRFKRVLRTFVASDEGHKALWMLAGLVTFLVSINALNVLNSYVGRDFMSAIADKNLPRFITRAWLYVGVFALSTVAAVMSSYLEQRLGLLWRDWQTRQLLSRYLANRAFYRLELEGYLQNPDQRIAEDVRSFTTTTLSFVLMMLNAAFTIVAFSGVLWSISPRLMIAAIAYALAGSFLAFWLGHRLVDLNVRQLDREADFRSELIQIREHSEPVALLQLEEFAHRRILKRLDYLVANWRQIISVNRRLGFFTNGYNYLIQIVPVIIVAPLFIRGDFEFGVVTQSVMAFAQLMGAFSLAVSQVQPISSYAATVSRLDKLMTAIRADEAAFGKPPPDSSGKPKHINYQHLTLYRPDGVCLIKDLTIQIERGARMLITGSSGHAKVALFRATAGMFNPIEGSIDRPDAEAMMFLPERPYLTKCTLREALVQPKKANSTPDSELLDILRRLQLEAVIEEAGGLDMDHDWANVIGISEQARLLVARIVLARPAFAFLDRLSTAMDKLHAQEVLKLLSEQNIAYMVLGTSDDQTNDFDTVLNIAMDGSWSLQKLTH